MKIQSDATSITAYVNGQDGPLAIIAKAPFTAAEIEPVWSRYLLACDGNDIGRRLLADLEPIKSLRERLKREDPIPVTTKGK